MWCCAMGIEIWEATIKDWCRRGVSERAEVRWKKRQTNQGEDFSRKNAGIVDWRKSFVDRKESFVVDWRNSTVDSRKKFLEC